MIPRDFFNDTFSATDWSVKPGDFFRWSPDVRTSFVLGTGISNFRTEISRVKLIVQRSGLNVQRYQYWFHFVSGICCARAQLPLWLFATFTSL